MSQAVYTQNENLFKQVVKKYDIQYVLVDKNVIAPGPGANPKVLFFKQIDELLRNDSDFNKINRFGNNLFVYSETGSQVNYNSDNWVYLLKSPPSVAPYTKAYYEDLHTKNIQTILRVIMVFFSHLEIFWIIRTESYQRLILKIMA